MNKTLFSKLFILGITFSIIPFLGGILIGKGAELVKEHPKSTPNISSLSLGAQTTAASEPIKIDIEPEVNPQIIEPEPTEPQPQPVTKQTSQPNPNPSPSPNTSPKIAGTASTTLKPTQPSCGTALAEAFLCLANKYRAEQGLGKLSYTSSLNQAALGHSIWMNTTGIFSHTGENGSRMIDRCAAIGIRCLAENLAENILDAQTLLNRWKANPGHNKNLLGPYTTAGFGVDGPYVTLIFN